jgi:hypothetical protein
MQGEYHVDKATGTLYYLPHEPMTAGKKTPFLRCHFSTNTDHFTKPGSGQTYENHSIFECGVFLWFLGLCGEAMPGR